MFFRTRCEEVVYIHAQDTRILTFHLWFQLDGAWRGYNWSSPESVAVPDLPENTERTSLGGTRLKGSEDVARFLGETSEGRETIHLWQIVRFQRLFQANAKITVVV